ncbi:MAG TPA: hypothetical protein VHX39_35100 [Acetobacteraceae bacterium]|jgi:hypothetical protein|nr:hypothetical protein [Acetobacteraceae bacterium]
MFDAIIAKCAASYSAASQSTSVVIPVDRPDLMADAGYEGLRYQGPAARRRDGKDWLAAYWMPFHAVAG